MTRSKIPDHDEPAVAPDFELIDTAGKVVKLSDYRGKRNVVLVFNRGFM